MFNIFLPSYTPYIIRLARKLSPIFKISALSPKFSLSSFINELLALIPRHTNPKSNSKSVFSSFSNSTKNESDLIYNNEVLVS